MSEPFLERLSRFTPDAGTLERDALLFAAGRRSARANRGWIALAAALLVGQALTLVLLWPAPVPPTTGGLTPRRSPPPAAGAPAAPEPPSSDAPDGPDIWSVRHSLPELEASDRPQPGNSVTIPDGGPPLRAFGPPPPSIPY
jgi:hypothetical protein